jgi:hypothetical protein
VGSTYAAYDNYTSDNDDVHIEATYYEPGMAFVGEYDSETGLDESYSVDFTDDDGMIHPDNLIDDWGLDYEYEQWQEWQEDEEEEDA